MKTSFLFVAAFCLSLAINAQDSDNEVKTLFNKSGSKANGGYGALMINYGKVANQDALLMGARGAWIIDHSFALGMGGYGIIAEPKKDAALNNEDYQYAGGYGGLILEPIVYGKSPVHLSFPVLIGAGGITYLNHLNAQYQPDYDYANSYEDSDAFFVLEPAAEIEFNMLKFFRVALSASYRYTSDINLKYQETEDPIAGTDMLHGWNFGLALKFGKF